MKNVFTQCIPVKLASQRYRIEQATLRKWVRSNKIPGIKIKPYQVSEPHLLNFLLENSNETLKQLYLDSGPDSPHTGRKRR